MLGMGQYSCQEGRGGCRGQLSQQLSHHVAVVNILNITQYLHKVLVPSCGQCQTIFKVNNVTFSGINKAAHYSAFNGKNNPRTYMNLFR